MAATSGYFDALFEELLKARHVNYSEECITYSISEDQFLIEDLHGVKNRWDERIKCTLIRHRNATEGKEINKTCIVYLHGFGSCRLEALHLVQYLPSSYCLCMFDMSGSGKSQGEFMTYGLKESQDIQPVITHLHKKKELHEFVLWGRSMGAVATLLYAIDNCPYVPNRNSRRTLYDSSLRNSIDVTAKTQQTKEDKDLVKAIVLDSPFHNFRDIAKELATSRYSVPGFLVDVAINYVESSFSHILNPRLGPEYTPFRINFNRQISVRIPILLIYSEKDEVVSSNHSERIIKQIKTKFEKILISEFKHNDPRPKEVVTLVFQKLENYNRTKDYEDRKLTNSVLKHSPTDLSCERKRGIFVFTPSRQKDSRPSSSEKFYHSSTKYQSEPFVANSPSTGVGSHKRSKISLQSPKATKPMIQDDDKLASIATVDSEASSLINKKLLGIRQSQITSVRMLRSKRCNAEKKLNAKLLLNRYLQ